MLIRVAKEKFSKLQKIVEGLEHAGVLNAWMRVNENGLYIETRNEATRISIFLHIQPNWFSRFVLPDNGHLLAPGKSIYFTISEFNAIVNSFDPSLHDCIDFWFSIPAFEKIRIEFFILKFIPENEGKYQAHPHRTMDVAVMETVNPLIDIERMLSMYSDTINEVDLNEEEFVRALLIAAQNNVKHVSLRITNSCVNITVPPDIHEYLLFQEFGCRIHLVPGVESITYKYPVRCFSTTYLHSILPILQHQGQDEQESTILTRPHFRRTGHASGCKDLAVDAREFRI